MPNEEAMFILAIFAIICIGMAFSGKELRKGWALAALWIWSRLLHEIFNLKDDLVISVLWIGISSHLIGMFVGFWMAYSAIRTLESRGVSIIPNKMRKL